ncbi:M23 family metallopeptidase [Acetonema longum]|uniref:Peptidase M23 n=1 Tax=Acetonema longum DSM 6540 TaxID=1009370 RepID=F7NHP5_9FIRM|nr:M23 family metallopeptidase [Acetonema longum]EGO64420.1 Peptidase M23 [Acetonema longum DSM 6540]
MRLAWLKKVLIAGLLFIITYAIHISDTPLAPTMNAAVKYLLTVETDLDMIVGQITPYMPRQFDSAWLNQVRATVAKPANPLLYMLKPVDGKLVAAYGWQTHQVLKQQVMYEGIGVEASQGTGVRAAAAGKVKLTDESAQFGKIVMLDHGQEVNTLYGHLGEVLVKPGDIVSQGQVIGRVGKTGMTSSPRLYFEIREKGQSIDPLQRIQGTFTEQSQDLGRK